MSRTDSPLATRAYVDRRVENLDLSYEDLKDLPTLNGVPLKGNVVVGEGGSVMPQLTEDQVKRIAQGVTDASLSADYPKFNEAVSDVVTAVRRVPASGWTTDDWTPGCTDLDSALEICVDDSGPHVVYSEGAWSLLGVTVGLSGSFNTGNYPDYVISGSYSVVAPEDADHLEFRFTLDSGPPLDDPDNGTHVDCEFTVSFSRDVRSENVLGLASAQDLNTALKNAKDYTDSSLNPGNTRFRDAVQGVSLPIDDRLQEEVCGLLGIDVDEFAGGGVTVGLVLSKMLALVKSVCATIADSTRYDLVTLSEGDRLRDRAMNCLETPGTYYPPEPVEGKARDFQVSYLVGGSSSAYVDLSPDMVFMDDRTAASRVVLYDPESDQEGVGQGVGRMFIFTEIASGKWYVNRIFDTSLASASVDGGAG